MIYLAVVTVYVAAIAACTYLAMNGHPVVGVIVLVCGLCVQASTGKKEKNEDQ